MVEAECPMTRASLTIGVAQIEIDHRAPRHTGKDIHHAPGRQIAGSVGDDGRHGRQHNDVVEPGIVASPPALKRAMPAS